MESLVNFWKGRSVFITGHTGFKGSWLSLWLQLLEAKVVGFALDPPTPLNLFDEADIASGMIDIRGDIRDYKKLSDSIVKHQPEIIFHLAAQPLVRYSYAHPIETYSTNVMGTAHLLEAARYTPTVKAIINVTTDKCYENNEINAAFKESDPMGGLDPYSSSKGCSELITNAYRNSYFKEKVGLASARAGNVIGGGDWATDRLIPDLINACLEKKSLEIRYPSAIRPWQHVLESLSGYLQLAQHLYVHPQHYSEAWNFGPNDEDDRTVAWITDQVISLWGEKLDWKPGDANPLYETGILKLNCTKAKEKLSWFPQWNILDALKFTVSWYQNYYNGHNARNLTEKQISEFTLQMNQV